jgi:hypothetical protein
MNSLSPSDSSSSSVVSNVSFSSQSVQTSADPIILPIDAALLEAVVKNREQRVPFVEALTTEEQTKAREMIKSVNTFQRKIIEWHSLPPNTSPEEVKRQKEELDELCQKLIASSKTDMKIDIKTELRASYTNDEGSAKELNNKIDEAVFYTELAINRTILEMHYSTELKNLLVTHKEKILKEFAPNLLENKDFVTFKVSPTSAETHNLGRKAMYIDGYSEQDSKEFTIVYKPRNALVDKAVIKVFEDINHLTEDGNLPVYKIIPIENQEGSFWEFIESEKTYEEELKKAAWNRQVPMVPFKKLVKTKKFGKKVLPEERERLRKKMKSDVVKMDSILAKLYVSDLHCENVIIRKSRKNPAILELVPIDLENVEPTLIQGTGLGVSRKRSSQVELSSNEKEIIDGFNQNLPSLPHRLVLIKTANLGMFMHLSTIDKLTDALFATIKEQGFEEKITRDELKMEALVNILNGDVPYFTSFNNTLHYGDINGKIMGKK